MNLSQKYLVREGINAIDTGQPQQTAAALALSFEFTDDPDLKLQAHEALTEIVDRVGSSALFELKLPAEIYVELGQAFLDANRPEAALELLLKVDDSLADEVFLAQVHFLQGSALRDLGRLSQAAESFELSLNTPFSKDSLVRAQLALAEIYRELNQVDLRPSP